MLRLGILGSTRGTDMLAISAAIQENRCAASIEVVISNKADALILERAAEHGLNAYFIDPTGLTRAQYDALLTLQLQEAGVDLIVLIGYMRILSNAFVQTWQGRIINVHPSLLPAFAGGMDTNVHLAVLQAGSTETGCTVHYVTAEVDAGPILIQKKCAVLPTDTADTLKERVQQLEGIALVEAIKQHALLFSYTYQ